MKNSTSSLRDQLADYAWRAWSALGVAGWNRDACAACIDIDALVLLTGRLGDTDPRLRDESIDWCVSNLALVSRSRLAHLLGKDSAQGGFAEYAATLQRATKQRWPGAGTAFEWTPSHKSRTPTSAEGATLALRCRALFGATARSEIVRILIMQESDRPLDARELALEAAYTKRSVSEALDSLRIAGIVAQTRVGNSHRYHFQRRAVVESLLGPLPRVRTSQRAFCRVLWAVLHTHVATASAPDRVQHVEGARLAAELAADIRVVDSNAPVLADAAPTLDDLLAWAVAEMEGFWRGSP